MCYACAVRGESASWASFDHALAESATEAPSAALGTAVTATSNQNIDALLSGYRWSGAVTYSFPDSRSDYESRYTESGASDFGPVSFNQMQAARYILEGTSPYAGGPRMGLTAFEQFTQASIRDAGKNGADIRIATSGAANPTAYAYYPGAGKVGGDVWFGTQHSYRNPVLGSYDYMTMIHELGHALGLKHGHEAGGVADTALSSADDSIEMSVMTYRSYVGQAPNGYTNETYGYAQTFMVYDVAALQTMYGANFTTNSDATTYSWDPLTGQAFVNGVGQGMPGANRVFLTIWDGGGNDTYDFSNYSTNLSIDLTPGGWSRLSAAQLADLGNGHDARGNVFNALQYNGDVRSLIENAKGGSGSDTIIGNATANTLSGNRGNDILEGGAGNDTLMGGAGNDVLQGGAGTNTAVFSGMRADYTITENADHTFKVLDGHSGRDGSDNLNNIAFALFDDQTFSFGAASTPVSLQALAASSILNGTSGNNILVGGEGDDRLYGYAGNDTLKSGTGNDVLKGGLGNDKLIGGAGKDTFLFNAAPGPSNVDRIRDFDVSEDIIQLENKAMSKLGVHGMLKKGAFYKGMAAHDATDRIIYNGKIGSLFYDPDGTGASSSIHLANLSKNLKLTYKDFFVV